MRIETILIVIQRLRIPYIQFNNWMRIEIGDTDVRLAKEIPYIQFNNWMRIETVITRNNRQRSNLHQM